MCLKERSQDTVIRICEKAPVLLSESVRTTAWPIIVEHWQSVNVCISWRVWKWVSCGPWPWGRPPCNSGFLAQTWGRNAASTDCGHTRALKGGKLPLLERVPVPSTFPCSFPTHSMLTLLEDGPAGISQACVSSAMYLCVIYPLHFILNFGVLLKRKQCRS